MSMEVGWLVGDKTLETLHNSSNSNHNRSKFVAHLNNLGVRPNPSFVIAVTERATDGAFYTGIAKTKLEEIQEAEMEYLALFDRSGNLICWKALKGQEFVEKIKAAQEVGDSSDKWTVTEAKDGRRLLFTIGKEQLSSWERPNSGGGAE